MGVTKVELGLPYTGWSVRAGNDYAFARDLVSAALEQRITAWAWEFSTNFDEEAGWRSEELRLAHLSEGLLLQRGLQDVLGAEYEVVLDPLGSGSRSSSAS